jgi:hypothetical protein
VTSVRRRNTLGRQRPRDVGEASTTGVLKAHAVSDGGRERWRAPSGTPNAWRTRGLKMLANKPLQLIERNQPLTPRRLDGVQGRHDPSIDR